MARIVIVFIIAVAVFAVLRMALRKRQLTVNQFFSLYFVVLTGISLLYLGVIGYLHPLFAIVGAALPFIMRFIPWVGRGFQAFSLLKALRGMGGGMAGASSGGSAPAQSEINTRYLHMVLVHATGMMDGTVCEGQFKSMQLSNLNLSQLMLLHGECMDDTDSVNVLSAYLDRVHENWRDGSEGEAGSAASGDMTEHEALEILGLEPSATQEDIIAAHRKLIQKMHPDRGGSTYLAARINEAKDFLLGGIR